MGSPQMHSWGGWALCSELIQVIRKAISLNRAWEQKAGRGDAGESGVLVCDHLRGQGQRCPIAPEPPQTKILHFLCLNRTAQNYSHQYRNSQVNPAKSPTANVASSTFSVALMRMLVESGNLNSLWNQFRLSRYLAKASFFVAVGTFSSQVLHHAVLAQDFSSSKKYYSHSQFQGVMGNPWYETYCA